MKVDHQARPAVGYIEVRRNGRLLFRFDPERDLVEVKHKGQPVQVVDLRPYREGGTVGTPATAEVKGSLIL